MPPKDPFRKWSQYFGPDFSPKHSYFLVCRVKITQTKRKKIQNWSKHRVKITSKRDYSVSKIFTALLALNYSFENYCATLDHHSYFDFYLYYWH